MDNVLVVAAHPDDEVLGCGATMAAHARRGDRVRVLIVGEGATSRAPGRSRSAWAKTLRRLQTMARKANEQLGVSAIEFLGLPDNRLDTVPLLRIVQSVEAVAARFRPAIVYTHHAGDLNVDHRRVNDAVRTAFRPLPGAPTSTLLFFEVPSSTEWSAGVAANEFAPHWFVDVSSTLTDKLAALRVYAPEMRDFPHPRSFEAVEHLARWRGASIGVAAAEAFVLGRHRARGIS